jgi:hypothetical protein
MPRPKRRFRSCWRRRIEPEKDTRDARQQTRNTNKNIRLMGGYFCCVDYASLLATLVLRQRKSRFFSSRLSRATFSGINLRIDSPQIQVSKIGRTRCHPSHSAHRINRKDRTYRIARHGISRVLNSNSMALSAQIDHLKRQADYEYNQKTGLKSEKDR